MMPSVASHMSYPGNKGRFGPEEKPSISCIATHAYWRQTAKQKELSYTTSFQKPQKYIDSLREEVSVGVFRHSIENNTTPVYAFEELKGVYHSTEYPLINKGLLASTKYEQHAGYTTPVEKPLPVNKPRPLPANRSFYRPNSTHNYLTKTIALGGSHDGFDPKHGTPTRAQLLRNRGKFTSAPDLTYLYVGHRKADGKHEAVYRKAKMADEALRLKMNKIEMDKTAAKYRQFVIGSAYNTSKWVGSQTQLIEDLVAMRSNRPASSVTPKVTPTAINVKRRAASAVANNEHLRHASTTPARKEGEHSREPPDRRTRPASCKEFSTGEKGLSTRSPNMRPYSASVNSRSIPSHLNASIIITSAAVDSTHTADNQNNNQRTSLARVHSATRLAPPAQIAVVPALAVSLKELQQAEGATSQSSRTTARELSSPKPVFLTSPQHSTAHEPTALSNNFNNNNLDLGDGVEESQVESGRGTEAKSGIDPTLSDSVTVSNIIEQAPLTAAYDEMNQVSANLVSSANECGNRHLPSLTDSSSISPRVESHVSEKEPITDRVDAALTED